MNRLDEIKAAALDAAQHVTQDPEKRAAMADDLITLVGLMIQAVGKSVAIDGESDMNAPDTDVEPDSAEYLMMQNLAHTRYLVGESMQDGARQVVDRSKVADLTRYEGGLYGRPVWRPRCIECGVRVGMPNQFDPLNAVGGIGNLGHAAGCQTEKRSPHCSATRWPHRGDCPWHRVHTGTAKDLSVPAAGVSRCNCDRIGPYGFHYEGCIYHQPVVDPVAFWTTSANRACTGCGRTEGHSSDCAFRPSPMPDQCHWSPDCTGPEGCPNHNLPRCPGCGDVADGHGTSCVM